MSALPGDRFWRLVRPWAAPLFESLLRLRVQGSGNVPRKGPLLLVSNHVLMHAGQITSVRRKQGKPVLF